MDIRIGVTYSAKELEVEMPDGTEVEAVRRDVEAAMDAGTVLWLTDRRGRSIGVPSDKIAYVDLGPAVGDRRIGFAG